jgi:hypothetical protein
VPIAILAPARRGRADQQERIRGPGLRQPIAETPAQGGGQAAQDRRGRMEWVAALEQGNVGSPHRREGRQFGLRPPRACLLRLPVAQAAARSRR